jgi:hypothetical protein
LKSVHPGLISILAILLLLPGLVFIGLRLTLPGDASTPLIDFQQINSGGLVVQPPSPGLKRLRKGDIVTAIQGQAIAHYLGGLLSL